MIGQQIERFDQVGSTNDLVRERARAGAVEGLVITAERQLAGRGRLGRGWQAPSGSSLLLSVLLRPTWLPPDGAYAITMLAAVALCNAVEQTVPGLQALLKWPNDLLLPVLTVGVRGQGSEVGEGNQGSGVRGQGSGVGERTLRKAAGILSELALNGEMIDYVILGMGVNVNWSPSGLVDGRDLAEQATSVAKAAGYTIDREALFDHLLTQLATHYTLLRRGQRESIFQAWRGRLATLGQYVAVTTANSTFHGVAEDVNFHGALLVRDTHGIVHTVTAGDVGA